VRLVSYPRDLVVWMIPRVRRVRFLLAIVLKVNAVFVPFLSFFEFYDYCFKVQNLACSSSYGIKIPPIPVGKSQPPKSLWYGTNRTSRPQQETLD